MSGPILSQKAPILLVGAGPVCPELVTKTFAHAESVLAVDGGLDHARAAGVPVHHVIGDMDSGMPPPDIQCHKIKDQNTTDFQKALSAVQAPLILGVGFLGGRLDHQMANFAAMLNDPRAIVLCDETQIAFIAPRDFSLPIKAGLTVGFYPLRPVTVSIKGVKWPLDQMQMAPDGVISTSNQTTGDDLTISSDRHGLLCILPFEVLPDVIKAILGPI